MGQSSDLCHRIAIQYMLMIEFTTTPMEFSIEEKKTQSLLLAQDRIMDILYLGTLQSVHAGVHIDNFSVGGI
jgi:hypothetical protein